MNKLPLPRLFIAVLLSSPLLMAAAPAAPILLGDPTIYVNDGTFYLYGTMPGGPTKTGSGFPVYTSTDLTHWSGPNGARDGLALKKGDAFGDKGFWAPQIFQHQGRFYMAYTANEHIAMAVGDSPRGPFTSATKLAFESPTKQIDPYVFFDDDGRAYLYHVRLGGGNTIWVAELNADLMSIKPDTARVCIRSEKGWEDTEKYPSAPIAEGPTVIKHKGFYYLLYSANHFLSYDYAVGYAVSSSPLGPWQKAATNPLIHGRMLGASGTGHGDLLQDKEGKFFYVFHTHASMEQVQPRKAAIVSVEFVPDGSGPDRMIIHPETFHLLELSAP